MSGLYPEFDPFEPAIDQPVTVDIDTLSPEQRFRHSNSEIEYSCDRHGDLYDLVWPWHNRTYARSIQVQISAPIYTEAGISSDPVEDVLPMVVRFYSGYQETIYGTESGVILSKRIFAPLGSGYDRSLLWLLECQAEGDRLLRIEIDIDWGEPLEQRMVDGLLVAQVNPGEAQGMHEQRNAESTRVFGTGGGRPDWVEFPDQQRARLIYHLLVAGQVDLPLILTLSDVGEQVAWNGFLAQRDISRAFKLSEDVWTKISRSGRLWTPYPPLNRVVQLGKEAAIQQLRRFRSGYAPVNQETVHIPVLVDVLDTFDPQRSRALLEHLHRVATRMGGRLPVTLPTLPGPTPPPDPGMQVVETNVAYIQSLAQHLSRHPDSALLNDQYATLQLCVEILQQASIPPEHQHAAHVQMGLYLAARLAALQGRHTDEVQWARAAAAIRPRNSISPRLLSSSWETLDALTDLASLSAYRWSELVAEAVWQGCGLSVRHGEIHVSPRWPQEWGWWALLDLPLLGNSLSLLWDGETLHSTRPVRFHGPTEQHDKIRAEGSDADSFHLRFHTIRGNQRRTLRPLFYEQTSWRKRQTIKVL